MGDDGHIANIGFMKLAYLFIIYVVAFCPKMSFCILFEKLCYRISHVDTNITSYLHALARRLCDLS